MPKWKHSWNDWPRKSGRWTRSGLFRSRVRRSKNSSQVNDAAPEQNETDSTRECSGADVSAGRRLLGNRSTQRQFQHGGGRKRCLRDRSGAGPIVRRNYNSLPDVDVVGVTNAFAIGLEYLGPFIGDRKSVV